VTLSAKLTKVEHEELIERDIESLKLAEASLANGRRGMYERMAP
jgi:hypothetical protein